MILTKEEIDALREVREYVRVRMAHDHSWKVRDTAMDALGKVIASADKEAP